MASALPLLSSIYFWLNECFGVILPAVAHTDNDFIRATEWRGESGITKAEPTPSAVRQVSDRKRGLTGMVGTTMN